MNELPIGWTSAALGELAQYLNGAAFKPADWNGEGRPIIRIQNLTDPSKPMNRTQRKLDDKYLVTTGDLLVSWSASLDAFLWDREKSWLNQHIFKVTPRPGIDKQFLFFVLKREIFALAETEHLHGSTMKHINRGPFLAHRIKLPPSKEQRRIVARLERLLARTKVANDELSHIPLLFDHYRQAIFEKAFSGELTADWRETVGVTHTKIPQGRAGYSRSFPDRWSPRPLGDLIENGPQNGLYLPKSEYGQGCPILRIENFQDFSSDSISEFKMVNANDEDRDRYRLEEGDIVINRVNSPTHLGKCLRIAERHAGALFESNMMRFVLKSEFDPDYVCHFLKSPSGRASLLAGAKWAVNQASINQTDVISTVVPIPDLTEQREIVRRIEAAMEWLSIISEEWNKATHLLQQLDLGLVAKALRGELVLQDGSDEPADQLLKKIQGQRGALPKARGKRRVA